MYDVEIILEREYHNQVLDKRQWKYEDAKDYFFSADDAMFVLTDSEETQHFFPYERIRKVGVTEKGKPQTILKAVD